MHWQRNLIWLVIAVGLITAIVVGLQPQPRMVEVAAAKVAPLTLTLSEEGQTRVVNRYDILAPVAGFLQRVQLDVGDPVKKGQPLLELSPLPVAILDPRRRAEAEARVAAAQAALLAAEQAVAAAAADADYARTEHQRAERLKKTQAVSQEQWLQTKTVLQRREAQLRSARFAVEIAEHDVEAAQTLLKYSVATEAPVGAGETLVIRSPIDGVVLQVIRESEGVVGAGEPLLRVGNPQDLEVVVDVLSADAVRIQAGTPVRLLRWGGESLTAQVQRVEPVAFTEISALGVEEQRVWVVVEIHSPVANWQRLGHGYRVEADFILWQQADILQVPESALFRLPADWGVYRLVDDEARLTPVQVGQRNGLQAHIEAGLEVGDIVILYPDDALSEGVLVQSRK